MFLLSLILAATLSRSELIERMRAFPVTRCAGLVQVYAHCPADMRDEYQMPVATFVSKLCDDIASSKADIAFLSSATNMPSKYTDAGIMVIIGDTRTNDASVVSRPFKRKDGSCCTRIFLPAPAYSDIERLRLEIVKAYCFSVAKKTVGDEEAKRILRDSNPQLRIDHKYDEIDRWLRGEKTDGGDEEMLKLCRTVLQPGVARESDVLRFASRLCLYPLLYRYPLAGKYRCCSFSQALDIFTLDPTVRYVAYLKAPQIVAYGGGRGEHLASAAEAYSEFLFELAKAKKNREELLQMLEAADIKLNVALEEARKYDQGRK
jgi:hypothetical protein